MNILLLSAGGGGGNILRSLKTLFDRDVAVTRAADPTCADRLQSAVTTRFLDTNEFSLSDLPVEERLLIGARTTGRIGARHNPDVAREALEESRRDVEAVMRAHSVVILIGTGGKGTGAGTMFPLAELARKQKKLVLPIFVRPSFERHEVDKRRYDHALKVCEQFDAAGIRLIEILNDRGYDECDPAPQHVVWERMNLPIAKGLRGLIYVLWDLSQVDPSDLSTLLAGCGRIRIGSGDIDAPAGVDPSDDQVAYAVGCCWDNPYYAFSRPAGTSLICIHGEWSNIVDAKIKGGIAERAAAGTAKSPYNPLYTRTVRSPRPWGVTALFGEYTGVHPPLEISWACDAPTPQVASIGSSAQGVPLPAHLGAEAAAVPVAPLPVDSVGFRQPETGAPPGLWEFAVAVNRSDPAALAMADNGAATAIAVEGSEVKRLLGTMWFRTIVPRLSRAWQTRLLDALVDGVVIPNHGVKLGRQTVPMSELTYSQLRDAAATSWMPDAARADLDLLVAVGRLWGEEAVQRLRFVPAPQLRASSKIAGVLEGLIR